MDRCIILLLLSLTFSKNITEGIEEAYDEVKSLYPKEHGIIYFLHDQFEDIPYYLNWCDDDYCKRNNIIDTYTMKSLGDSKQIDRVPEVFLKDWVSDNKRYKDGSRSFRTFGWCSEYEMSFCTLLSILGYKCKIYQIGNHVTTKVWLDDYILDIDNTYYFMKIKRHQKDYDRWIIDYGKGDEKQWYNESVKESIDIVKNIGVDNQFVDRMIHKVKHN